MYSVRALVVSLSVWMSLMMCSADPLMIGGDLGMLLGQPAMLGRARAVEARRVVRRGVVVRILALVGACFCWIGVVVMVVVRMEMRS